MTQFTQAWYAAQLAKRGQSLTTASHAVECEADLHAEILAECRRCGWIALHGRMDSETGRTVGEPDFTILADHGRVLFIECKSKTGKLRPEQAALHAWAEKLGHRMVVVRSLQEFIDEARHNAPQSLQNAPGRVGSQSSVQSTQTDAVATDGCKVTVSTVQP